MLEISIGLPLPLVLVVACFWPELGIMRLLYSPHVWRGAQRGM